MSEHLRASILVCKLQWRGLDIAAEERLSAILPIRGLLWGQAFGKCQRMRKMEVLSRDHITRTATRTHVTRSPSILFFILPLHYVMFLIIQIHSQA